MNSGCSKINFSNNVFNFLCCENTIQQFTTSLLKNEFLNVLLRRRAKFGSCGMDQDGGEPCTCGTTFFRLA